MAEQETGAEGVVVEQPVVAAPEVPVAPAAQDAPVVETVETKADAPVVEEKSPTVAETASLLEEAKAPGEAEKPVEEKAAETPASEKAAEAKAVEEKPAEVKAEEKPAETESKPAETQQLQPVEYKYELPENVRLDDGRRGELHTVLDGFRADPSNVQPLVDFHVAEINRVAERMAQDQQDIFNETRRGWREEIKADEQLGGSGFDTTSRAVARMRDLLVSSHPRGTPEYDAETKEFNEMCRYTGAGDHKALWRLLHNAARLLDEPQVNSSEIRPAPGGTRPGSRRGLLYNHPSSPNNRE